MELRSEYQRKFTDSARKHKLDTYKNMVETRKCRRLRESQHTPILWLEDDQNDDLCSKAVLCKLKQKTVLKENQLTTSNQLPNPVVETEKIAKRDVEVQTPKKFLHLQKQTATNPKKKIKLQRNKQKMPPVFTGHSKPVIAYGWADKTSIWEKKTFNVKAPLKEVKCSAIRAAKIRENRSQRLSRQEKLELEKAKTKVDVESVAKFEHWQTEYQKQFCKNS